MQEFQSTRIFFAKGYAPNWSEEVFVISKVENTLPCTYIISDFNSKENSLTFYAKALQKTNQTEFRVKKVIERKSDKLHVKWKGYDNSVNSWIDKSDIVYSCSHHIKMSEHFPKPFECFDG